MSKVIVELKNVDKAFDEKMIIKNMNLKVYDGEFLTLLGPSGCGKTTVLRLISGLEHVTNGEVFIDSRNVTNLDSTKREVNTIFQNLAIFPHMSVYDNVAFGLKMKKVSPDTIDKRVKETLNIVELKGFEGRMPSQLSGGQLQRVAIARGIIMNPKVLLLDESLCSLDLKLKRAMQIELKKIQKKLGLTFIYVTHDQDEALTMSDRIVIINDGVIIQDDTPQNIYLHPSDVFAADFIGESNILDAEIISIKNKETIISVFGNEYSIPNVESDEVGKKIKILIRPENIKVVAKKEGNVLGIVKEIVYDGAVTKYFITTNKGVNLRVNVMGNYRLEESDNICLKVTNNDLFPLRGDNNA